MAESNPVPSDPWLSYPNSDPNLRARAMLLTDEAGRRHIAPAIHFRDEPAQPTLREPLLGEHTAEILARIEPDQPVPRAAGR
jgi:crotonobetainyl-CoA:carnitine CoA-transferase CaiB-like acyl-CoA transferase